jgi:Domain of unknown function DUF29
MEKPSKNLEDQYKWALETAAAIRAGNFDAIDRDALVNELERSIAGGLKRELSSSVRDVIRAKLLLKFSPDSDRAWNESLLYSGLDGVSSLIWACPSLLEVVTEQFVAEAFLDAVYILGDEMTLPERCPYSCEQILKEAETFEVVA